MQPKEKGQTDRQRPTQHYTENYRFLLVNFNIFSLVVFHLISWKENRSRTSFVAKIHENRKYDYLILLATMRKIHGK